MKLSALAEVLGGTLHGDGDIVVTQPAHPAEATHAQDLAVAMSADLVALLAQSPARAALVARGAVVPDGAVDGWIEVGRPRHAMARLTRTFAPPPHAPVGIHPSAVVEPDAELGEGVSIGPLAYVGPKARLGARTIVMAQASIGAGAELGEDGLIHSGVRIGWGCRIGARAIIHHNASIGADGFSFVTPDRGSVEEAKASGTVTDATRNLVIDRIASLGIVDIGDDVEIGALTAIDRGTLSATRIGSGTKIDDLVMIGHNVVVGRLCMICGQVGIAGSTRIGDRVVLAGQVGIADHLTIGDDVVVGANAGVGSDIPPRSVMLGSPAVPKQVAFEQFRLVRRLRSLFNDVAELKRRLPPAP